MKIILLVLLFITPVQAGKWSRSILILIGANAVDIHSSIGKRELNPLAQGPNGKFDLKRGILLKSASVGTILLIEHLYQRKNPKRKKFTSKVNYAISAGIGVVAVRNYTIRK